MQGGALNRNRAPGRFDPNKPTCKAVSEISALGTMSGARIYPRGCQLRYYVPYGSNTVRKWRRRDDYTKPQKRTVTYYGQVPELDVPVSAFHNIDDDEKRDFTWDTGAWNTNMKFQTAIDMGIIVQGQHNDAGRNFPGGNYMLAPQAGGPIILNQVLVANGQYQNMYQVPGVRLRVWFNNRSEGVNSEVWIAEEGNNGAADLFGLATMRLLKRFKVKFRPAADAPAGLPANGLVIGPYGA